MLWTKEEFGDLDHFRDSLNKVQSFADFLFDVSRELLVYADTLSMDNTAPDVEKPAVTDREAARLQAIKKRRRGQRLKFFNTADGTKLRLEVKPHQQRQSAGWLNTAVCAGVLRHHYAEERVLNA